MTAVRVDEHSTSFRTSSGAICSAVCPLRTRLINKIAVRHEEEPVHQFERRSSND